MFRAIDNFFLRIEKDLFGVPALGEVDTPDESQIIDGLNKAFNAKLEEFKENEFKLKSEVDCFTCGRPLSKLLKADINPLREIILNQSVIKKAIGLKKGKIDEAHNLKIADFIDFPEKINSPILIIKGSVSNSRLLVVPINTTKGRTTVAALHLEFWNEKGVFVNIASIYSKPNQAMADLIVMAEAKNEVYFADGDKIKSLLSLTGQLQLLPSLTKDLTGTKLAPKIDKDKVFNQKNLLAKLVLPENCQTSRDCAVQIYECIAGIDLLRMMNRNYTNVQKRVFALAGRYRQLAKSEGVAYDWKTAMQKYLDEPDQPVNGLDTELIEEIASIPDSKPEEGGKVVPFTPKAKEKKSEPTKPESKERQPEPEAQKFDFIYEVSHGGGYYIKTFLRLPVSASVKDVTTGDNTIPGLRNYSATEKGLKDLQAKYTSAYGDKQRLSSQDLNNPTPEPAKPSTILPRVSPEDIEYNRAYRAYTGTSFSPEKRAKSAQESWANAVNEFAEKLESVIKTAEQNTEAKREFSDYVAKSKSKYYAWLGAKANCISSMITGSSNFPVRRAEKANRTEENRGKEYFDFSEKAEARIIKYIKGLDKAGAAAELDERNEKIITGYLADIAAIVRGKSPYSKTLIVDAFFRKLEKMPREAKQYAIDTFKKYQDETGTIVFKPNHRFWRMLDGNAENEVTEQTVNKTTETIYKAEGVEIVNNFEAERVQIATPAKPSAEIITYLKKHGFRWSPSGKVWQRQNTNAGVYEALNFGKKFFPTTSPEPDKPKQPEKQQAETPKITSIRKQIVDFPINKLHVDEMRFQNRDNPYSEVSKDKIIKAVKDGSFDWAKFDPAIIWLDPKVNAHYVLSGHSRRAAFKQLHESGNKDFATIPTTIFEGSEAEAIELALNSNTLATKETETERAGYYAKMRLQCEVGNLKGLGAVRNDCEKMVQDKIRENEGKNANFIINLSYLNPNGLLMDSMRATGAEKDNDSTNVLRTVANWTGEARRTYPAISDQWENEIGRWLLGGAYGNKKGQFRNKTEFLERVRVALQKFTGQPGDALNIAQLVSKSPFETEHEKRLNEARERLAEAEREHREKYDKYLQGLIENKLTETRLNELMRPLTEYVAKCRAEVERIKGQSGHIREAEKAQKTLFGLAPLGSTKKAKTQRLRGDIGRFLGEFDRVNYSIVLRGDKGAGKSRLLFQFVNAFAEKSMRCALLSIEMSPESSVIHRYTSEYIAADSKSKIQITGESQDYESLSAICKMFDVVAIDSWTKLKNVSQDDFDRLQKENPSTIILAVFQSTTGKVTRGGNMPEFDAGTVIHVHEGGLAECEKNRYSDNKHLFNVFTRRLMSDDIKENKEEKKA